MIKYKKGDPQYKGMRLITIITLSLFLSVGLVFAVGNGTPKSLQLNVECIEIINSINNDTLMRDDLDCDDTKCSQRMWKGDYNLGEVSISRYKCNEYSEPENESEGIVCLNLVEIKDDKIIEEITKQQNKNLESTCKVITKRQEKEQNKKTIIDNGEIILEVTP